MVNKVNAINSSKLVIEFGNGASPETFAQRCMINTSRGIQFSSSPTESLIPFCPPNEDLAAWIDREMDALTAQITGAGMYNAATNDQEFFSDWFILGETKNARVYVGTIGYYDGAWILPNFSITGDGRRAKVTFDMTMQSDGPIDWHTTT